MQSQKYIILVCVGMLLSSCGAYFHQPMRTTHARIGEDTYSTQLLKSLPPAQEKIYAAVYKFRDQTGQYRPSAQGQNWSTAVTQGGTNILIRALENSNWFVPVERENVSNLLNERKIIRSSRAQYADPNSDAPLLPPLLFAGIILEGGIISYDANIVTGGVGARYLGIGASAQYRQDRVSVYLRAISTQNGRVLKTVYTSKTILSQSIDGSLFRFVSFQKLLEAETGFTYNEPSELAVSEAIEKAVYAMIMEGIEDDLWTLAENPEDSTAVDVLAAYHKEKEESEQIDLFGRMLKHRRTKISTGLSGQAVLYNGDLSDAELAGGGNLDIEYGLLPTLGIGLEAGTSKFSTKEYIDDYINYLNVYGKIRLLPYDRMSPYLKLGTGIFMNTGEEALSFNGTEIGQVFYGGGLEYLLTDKIGIHGEVNHHVLFSDQGDFIDQGKYNDMYLRGTVGLRYYIGKTKQEKVNIYE